MYAKDSVLVICSTYNAFSGESLQMIDIFVTEGNWKTSLGVFFLFHTTFNNSSRAALFNHN